MVPTPELPLSGMADTTYFKVYLADVGLLLKNSNIHFKTILDGDSAYIRFKGALSENYCLTQLKCMGIEGYFWRTKADAELDFLTDYGGAIVPIEVKSADNTKAKSLKLFCSRYEPKTAIKTSLKNVGENMIGATRVWSIPLYTLFRIKEYLAPLYK